MAEDKKKVQDKRIEEILKQINEPERPSMRAEELRQTLTNANSLRRKNLEQASMDRRVEKIKEGIEGAKPFKPLDFNQVDFSRYADSKIKALGEVYASMEGFFKSISRFFGSLPIASQLRVSLRCAGMKIEAETYVALVSTLAFVAAVFMMLLVPAVGITTGLLSFGDIVSTSIFVLASGFFTFVIVGILGLAYPNIVGHSRASAIDRELPFALRHLATQMGAGMSFQKALTSVANADYGVLSLELRQTISRMDSGMSTEDALLDLGERTYSAGLKQTVIQIVRALRTGGRISEIITSIADDVAFETRMKVRDFTETLNLINIIYIMVAVVAPVVTCIMSSILQLPMLGAGISPIVIVAIFGGLVLAMVTILLVIKQFEPMAM